MRIHAVGLLYFDAVRRAGSIRAAARRLNVASSAVNRQILKLEAEVGAPLFERFAGGIKLTAAGEALARHVLVVMQDLERARADIEGLKGGRTGHINIAAAEGPCSDLLPAALARLREQAPRVTVAVQRIGSMAMPALIASGEADLGIGFDLPPHRGIRAVTVGRFALGAVMAASHPLAGAAKLTLAACLEHPIMFPQADLSIGERLAPALANVRRPLAPVLRSNSIELMRGLAKTGFAIAFQVRIGLERELAAGELVHVPLDAGGPVLSDLGIYVRAERSVPATLDLFLQILSNELREREAQSQHGRPGG